MSTHFVFDIETVPDYEALALLSPYTGEFDEEAARKRSRKKKKETIDADVEEMRKRWDSTPPGDREQDHYDSLARGEGATLKPHFSKIGGVAYWTPEEGSKVVLADDKVSEEAICKSLVDRIAAADQVQGWGIHDFDLPFLEIRAYACKIGWPAGIRRGRYYAEHITDMQTEYSAGNSSIMRKHGLKKAAPALGVIGRCPGEGGRWHSYTDEKKREYCQWDIDAIVGMGRFLRMLPREEAA